MCDVAPFAWVFNLDAEGELQALRAGRDYAHNVRVPEHAIAAVASVQSNERPYGFMAAGEVLAGAAAGVLSPTGDLWCPTPSALARLAASAASVPAAPGVNTLIRANARETFAGVDPLPGALVCSTEQDARAALGRTPISRSPRAEKAPAWRLRSSLATAGRERFMTGAPRGAQGGAQPGSPPDAVMGFVRRALLGGPVHIEPVVDIEAEFAVHGRIDPDGCVRSGVPVQQTVAGGSWRGATVLRDGEYRAALTRAFERVARDLFAMGYFGPFGMDAFCWRDASGDVHLHAPSDVNARYTMSFAIGAPHLIGARAREDST